jgi:ribosome biogenesis GTPase A
MDIKKALKDKIDIKKIFPEKIDLTGFVNDFFDTMKSKSEETGTFNILITGKTGVGKSTLINAVFRENLAETGIGAPVTDSINLITKKGVPIGILRTNWINLKQENPSSNPSYSDF